MQTVALTIEVQEGALHGLRDLRIAQQSFSVPVVKILLHALPDLGVGFGPRFVLDFLAPCLQTPG